MLKEVHAGNFVPFDISQHCRRLRMQVTVMKHYQPNPLRNANGSLPEMKCFNLNDYPSTSRYLRLTPVFKLVDSYLDSTRTSNYNSATMKSCYNNNRNKIQSVDDVGDRYITKKTALPNYHVNASGVHPGSVKCPIHDRVRTNMLNITNRNALRLSVKEGHCKHKIYSQPLGAEIHEIVQPTPVLDPYVEQLKNEIKNCISKCCHLQKDNEEYVRRLREEIKASRATMSDQTRNQINELKGEIYHYRLQPMSLCPVYRPAGISTIQTPCPMSKLNRTAPQELVKRVGQPTVQEKSDLDRSVKTRYKSPERTNTDSPKTHFEEKLEEANELIEKVRKTLKDMGVRKYAKPKNGVCTITKPTKLCATSNCIGAVANLLKDIDNQNKEIIKKLPTFVDKEKEEELRKKLEKELSEQKEAEYQRQLQEALEKQKEELRKKMEEDLDKLEAEKKAQQEQEQKQEQEQEKNEADLGSTEWIASNEKDFILQMSYSFNENSQSESVEERLKTISELTVENDDLSLESDTTEVEALGSYTVFGTKTIMEPVQEEPEPLESQTETNIIQPPPINVEKTEVKVEKTVPIVEKTVPKMETPEPKVEKVEPKVEKTEPEPKQKLQVQKMPPVSIRGGLVIQKTLNLTIKPTGSVTNDLVVDDQSNICYEEIKKDMDGADLNIAIPPLGTIPKCPEDCKELDGLCRYKGLDDQRLRGDLSPNMLTEEALMLLTSYQILDQNVQHSEASSTSSAANFTHKYMKYMHPQTPDRSIASAGSKPTSNTTIDKPPIPITTSVALGLGPHPSLDDLLTGARNPYEIGFYECKSTQCSGTNLATQQEGDGFVEGYMNDWEAPRQSSSQDTLMRTRLETEIQQTQSRVEEQEEEPVRDSPIPAITSTASCKRRVSMAYDVRGTDDEEKLIDSKDYLSYGSKNSQNEPERTPLLSQTKPILSQKSIEATFIAKRASRSSSSLEISTTDSMDASPKYHREPKKKKNSLSSSSSSSMFDIKDKRPSGVSAGRASYDGANRQHSIGSYAILKTMIQSDKPKDPEDTTTTKKKKPKPGEKAQMEDKELQTSFLSLSESTTTRSTLSGEPINTMKSFIYGLTGASEEEITRLRSMPTIPSKLSSPTGRRHQQMSKSTSASKNDKKAKERLMKVSDFEVAKEEEELSLLDYSTVQLSPKDDESPDILMGDVIDDKVIRETGRGKNFQKFAKETLAARRRSRQASTVMTLIEERRKSLDCGEGNNQKTLPFYRRVFNKPLHLEQSQSDPIPIDNSYSEGEITCKCSISSGEVHSCKQRTERRTKHLKKYTEVKKKLGDPSLTIARQRTRYNNWITYYLGKSKNRGPSEDSSIASSVDTSKCD